MRFSYDFLRDAFSALLTDITNLSNPNPHIAQFTRKCKITRQLIKDKSVISDSPLDDFHVLKTFASGSVGMVCKLN